MILWIDAQLSPALAPWINATFGIPATSNASLRQILERALPAALDLLQSGESVVEVR
jgi:predicted nuclease of predicted toxin-antitoxin system